MTGSSLAFRPSATTRKLELCVVNSNNIEPKSERRFLFPCNPLDEKQADEPFQDEFIALKDAGAKCSVFDFDDLEFGFKPKPKIQPDDSVMYRGWMMEPNTYAGMVTQIKAKGGQVLTNVAQYTQCHHLPGWYEACRQFTPETVWYPLEEDDDKYHKLKDKIALLDFDENPYFVKDYVKSNSDSYGSFAASVEQAMDIVRRISQYRGTLEGGAVLRQVEDFLPDTEVRYFVLNGNAYGPKEEDVPDMVKTIAAMVDAPFYSVDTIMRKDGTLRLVEIGDGQVSDKKTWPLERFVQMLLDG